MTIASVGCSLHCVSVSVPPTPPMQHTQKLTRSGLEGGVWCGVLDRRWNSRLTLSSTHHTPPHMCSVLWEQSSIFCTATREGAFFDTEWRHNAESLCEGLDPQLRERGGCPAGKKSMGPMPPISCGELEWTKTLPTSVVQRDEGSTTCIPREDQEVIGRPATDDETGDWGLAFWGWTDGRHRASPARHLSAA